MKITEDFKQLTKFERALWLVSLCFITISFFFTPEKDYLSLLASLVGATALIFVAKGFVLGQVLTVVFSLLYGVISLSFNYYGEMITYLFMTMPMAIMATIEWIKNPYEGTKEVKVKKMSKNDTLIMIFLSITVTAVFYFILKALDTANLGFSTLSITTSFLASYLTYKRSPFYAFAYAGNDVVLIVLWVLASLVNISYLPMVGCFVVFLANDIYGFFNWRRMGKRQAN